MGREAHCVECRFEGGGVEDRRASGRKGSIERRLGIAGSDIKASVFICHSSSDARAAATICASLEGAGIKCWIAPRDPDPGIPYARQLVAAIDECPVVLLILTSNSNHSRPVLNEVELAANRGKIILPFRLEDVAPSADLEFYVRSVHWFDATSRAIADSAIDLAALIRRVVPEMGDGPKPKPRAASPVAAAHPLPLQAASFVGRTRELSEITDAMASSRLVTILGAGGIGKTQCALQVARGISASAQSPIAFVELAPLTDETLVASAIASKADVKLGAGEDPTESLVRAIGPRRMLVILDNCEHIVAGAAAVAAALLRDCPEVTILATSRQPLDIAGEHTYRLGPLPSEDAVKLFVQRGRAVNPGWTTNAGDETTIGEICRRLDGIPLAIELAAARMNVLGVRQLNEMLDARFRVLSHGRRDAVPRQQTLQAAIDWSYNLLDERERTLFRRAGAFAEGFSLEGAISVCGRGGWDATLTMDQLGSLIDKSLVQADLQSATPRYRLLESMRTYARERLKIDGEYDEAFDRHLDYLLRLFLKAGSEYEATMSGETVTRVAVELEDARAALDWGLKRGNVAAAADLFLATRLWDHLGLHREAVERAKRLMLLMPDSDSSRIAQLWERIALLSSRTGNQTQAKVAAQHAMPYARASGEPGVLADCLLRFADVMAYARCFSEAVAALEESAPLVEASARRTLQALNTRGLIAQIQGDLETSRNCYLQALQKYGSIGHDYGAVSAALNLAEIEHHYGATAEAIRIANDALPKAECLPDRGVWAQITRNLAGYLAASDDSAGAQSAARIAVDYYRSVDSEGAFAAIALEHLACSLALDGDVETAAFLEGYAQAKIVEQGFEREKTEQRSHERIMEILEKKMPASALDSALRRGERATASEAFERALRPAVSTEPS